ncbi:hypothetical protein ANN_09050 [Periplaneta americana]|uniref:Uncharacterized protein n=1 Tax=Periplaneta americana TaxID=6978 RepID=A0ABQ8TMC7_PERAM|nr:hypothetical protein ANN_09050 [Periplaneta americana]
MDMREVGYDDRDWINLAQDRDQWRAYVRAAMNLRVPSKPFVFKKKRKEKEKRGGEGKEREGKGERKGKGRENKSGMKGNKRGMKRKGKGKERKYITVHETAESRPTSHSAECAPSIMAVDLDIRRQRVCLTWSQATKGNIEGGEFGPVLWIEFGVAQWSERLQQQQWWCWWSCGSRGGGLGVGGGGSSGSGGSGSSIIQHQIPPYCTVAVGFVVSNAGTDLDEKKESVGSLAEKKLPTEGYTRRNCEREKNSGQKKMSNNSTLRYMDHMRRLR